MPVWVRKITDTRGRKRRADQSPRSPNRGGGEGLALEVVAQDLGISSPKIVESLARRHKIRLRRTAEGLTVSAASLDRLRRLPEVRTMQAMARIDAGGGDLSDAEMRELSATRPGTLPWKRRPE